MIRERIHLKTVWGTFQEIVRFMTKEIANEVYPIYLPFFIGSVPV